MSLKRVSLKDIAQKVGVSTALVSYVLNNQKEGRISKEVAQKIRETARDLNYRTNQIARSLKTNRTLSLGLVVADISNSFSSSLARIIEDEAEKIGYTVLFGSSDESPQKSAKLIELLLNHQVDGLLIAPAAGTEYQLQSLQEAGVPFVLLDRYFPEIDAPHVAIDNLAASHTATLHLLENGHRRIGLIGFDTPLFHLQDRERGYTAALQHYGLPHREDHIRRLHGGCTRKEVEEAVASLLSLPEPVDALLFLSNTLSTHGLKYLNTLPLTVPDELAVVAFDQSDAAELFYAPLTFVKQPLEEMGKLATGFLLECIQGTAPVRQVNMPAELVIGKSSARLAHPGA